MIQKSWNSKFNNIPTCYLWRERSCCHWM